VNKKAKIILFCMAFVGSNVFSQPLENPPIKIQQLSLSKRLTVQINSNLSLPQLFPTSMQVISPNYYTDRLGYFCKQEIKFEKSTRVPLRFRLGSVADCDRLEGKFQKTN
jgi:hypothetical protein